MPYQSLREFTAHLEKTGRLVRVETAERVIEDAFDEIRREVMGLADAVGRLIDLDHPQRQAIEDACRAALTKAAASVAAEARGPATRSSSRSPRCRWTTGCPRSNSTCIPRSAARWPSCR